MIQLHILTIVALAILFLVGVLIPVHDKIKSYTLIYFENRKTYHKKSAVIYKVIMLLCVFAGCLYYLHPIFNKSFILSSQAFVNNMLVFGLNFIGCAVTILIGGFVGSQLVKIFDNK